MGGKDLKQWALKLLAQGNLNKALDEFCQLPARRIINPLFSFLSSTDPLIKWRSVSAMGIVVSKLAEKDMEKARVIIRRLIWSLNDESGGIGWGAPEAMGEIMAGHEELAKEYAHILISFIRPDGNFLEHELLRRGVVWGLGRLAQIRPQMARDAISYLLPYLDSKDATVRGLTAWVVGLLRAETARSRLKDLLTDNAEIQVYLDQELTFYRVSELAKQSLLALG